MKSLFFFVLGMLFGFVAATSTVWFLMPRNGPGVSTPEFHVVYFAAGSSALSDDAKRTIEFAGGTAHLRAGRVRITGHADLPGTEAETMALSEQRASSVRDVLVRLGVSSDAIQLDAKGETQPAVAGTEDKPEPRNDRVEIIVY